MDEIATLTLRMQYNYKNEYNNSDRDKSKGLDCVFSIYAVGTWVIVCGAIHIGHQAVVL